MNKEAIHLGEGVLVFNKMRRFEITVVINNEYHLFTSDDYSAKEAVCNIIDWLNSEIEEKYYISKVKECEFKYD